MSHNSVGLSSLPMLLPLLNRLLFVWRFWCFSIQDFQYPWVIVILMTILILINVILMKIMVLPLAASVVVLCISSLHCAPISTYFAGRNRICTLLRYWSCFTHIQKNWKSMEVYIPGVACSQQPTGVGIEIPNYFPFWKLALRFNLCPKAPLLD